MSVDRGKNRVANKGEAGPTDRRAKFVQVILMTSGKKSQPECSFLVGQFKDLLQIENRKTAQQALLPPPSTSVSFSWAEVDFGAWVPPPP